jgi:ProP effector
VIRHKARAVARRGPEEKESWTAPQSNASFPAAQPQPKRRNLYRERVIETLLALRQRFPHAFARLSDNRRRPLKIGIHVDIQAAMPDLDKIALSRALRFYVSDVRYHRAVTEGTKRIDLDGNAAGTVTAAEAENSQRSVAGIEAKLAQRRDWRVRVRAKSGGEKSPPEKPPPAPPTRLTLAELKAAAAARKGRAP